ncbi:aminotransferase class III-fold pyridoxal phosphate-dependent enzyme [Natronorubrum halophilum]|uniref:aminotransferase class III-fold pyridoxal phosphate-dependent enzyme n=1 Tax=Natronorubrum halophilum TaxID=1702106 RepID=UPI000EF69A1C|nr:aminotransferase class III-fold pyridoxal phosphate-dependent enzyme [Natronorubrum halophilum]
MSSGSPLASSSRSTRRSRELIERAANVVPGCSQTNSKRPSQFVQGVSPTHIERAQGSRLWDPDGNEYVDCNAALGPVLLGHNYPAVTEAVSRQLEDGTMYTMEHPLHVEVAELFTEVVPCAEMVKFAKSGNDVTALAAKVARAHTGRNVIATQGYHGWPDVWMGANEDLNRGIPDVVGDYTESFAYNDLESVERIFEDHPDDVAAIVTTPVNLEESEDGFLEDLRDLADREGAVLVFDEVLTGFRFAIGGAQEYFGVTPDLACFAKAMANGFPISALAGTREVMETIDDDDFFYSMTYAGDAVSLAAAKATITVQREEDVHGHIFRQGETLMNGYNELAAELELGDVTRANGFPPRFAIDFSDDVRIGSSTGDDSAGQLLRSLFMQEAHRRGVLYTGAHIPTYSHTDEDVEIVLDVYHECLTVVRDALEAGKVEQRLEGDPVGATLRERTGDEESSE